LERRQIAAAETPDHLVVAFGLWREEPAKGLEEAMATSIASLSPQLAVDPPEGTLEKVVAEVVPQGQREDGLKLFSVVAHAASSP
jgi:hypothetical protein